MCVWVPYLCVVPKKARRRHQIPCAWGHRWLWVLRIKLDPLEEQWVLLPNEPSLHTKPRFLRLQFARMVKQSEGCVTNYILIRRMYLNGYVLISWQPITSSPPKWMAEIERDDIDMLKELGSLTTANLMEKVRGLQNLAYQLGLDESREMTRGKFLNILEKPKK